MTETHTNRTQTPSLDTPPADSSPHQSSFITPEMIEKNPILAAAGIFAGDTLFDEVIKEIEKERARAIRRERRRVAK